MFPIFAVTAAAWQIWIRKGDSIRVVPKRIGCGVYIEIRKLCAVPLRFAVDGAVTARWSEKKIPKCRRVPLLLSHRKNQTFVFSVFLIFAVTTVASVPLPHRRYGFVAVTLLPVYA